MATEEKKHKAATDVGELKSMNAKTLAAYIRDVFEITADHNAGRAVLLNMAIMLHAEKGKPLAGVLDGKERPPTPPELAIEDARLVGPGIRTKPGDFPEAKEHRALATYVRYTEKDADNREGFTWFISPPTEKYPKGRHLMMGVVVYIQPQAQQLDYVEPRVNGMALLLLRERVYGIPYPHFEVLHGSRDWKMEYQKDPNKEKPHREFLRAQQSVYMEVRGECLCDPRTGEVVVQLSQMVITRELRSEVAKGAAKIENEAVQRM